MLSQFITIECSYFMSRSSKVCFIQITWVQHEVASMYSDSAVESEMEDFFLLNYDTKKFPNKNASPLVLFRLATLDAQSTSVNAFKMKSWIFGYHNPYSIVPFKYLKILFTAVTCVFLGLEWNLATKPTACITCGLVAVTYSRIPIMHSKMKHVPIKYHYLREHVSQKFVKLEYIDTK